MQYAVISSDQNLNYLFYAPLTSLTWQSIGYQTLFIYVSKDNEENEQQIFIKEFLQKVGVKIVTIYNNTDIPSGNLAQIARLYAFNYFTDSSVYLITGDVDMFVADPHFFAQRQSNFDIHLYYSNAYEYKRYPICYLGMSQKVWKQVIGNRGLEVLQEITVQLESNIGKTADLDTLWNYDEILFFNKLTANGQGFSKQYIERKCVGSLFGRVDRSDWTWSKTQKIIDCHLFRNPYTQLKNIREIFNHITNNKFSKLVDNYFEKIALYNNL